ncbi:hypothetical protein DFH09DRAFT_1355690 [Mycena vulgaris]|nr:hypothetical protein DFH09DRAFT_1355690 [Mycena vulgaris]
MRRTLIIQPYLPSSENWSLGSLRATFYQCLMSKLSTTSQESVLPDNSTQASTPELRTLEDARHPVAVEVAICAINAAESVGVPLGVALTLSKSDDEPFLRRVVGIIAHQLLTQHLFALASTSRGLEQLLAGGIRREVRVARSARGGSSNGGGRGARAVPADLLLLRHPPDPHLRQRPHVAAFSLAGHSLRQLGLYNATDVVSSWAAWVREFGEHGELHGDDFE